MSNRRPGDTFERCGNCRADGTCMYAGPCLACAFARGRANRADTSAALQAEKALRIAGRVLDRDPCPSAEAALKRAAVRYVIAAMRAAGTPAGGVRPVEDLLRALEQAAPERG